MKVISSNVYELADTNILRKIEKCGRICYKSEDKITDTSCFSFVSGLIKRQHMAMTEHANICLSLPKVLAQQVKNFGHGTYMNVTLNEKENRFLVSGNIRAWALLFDNPQWDIVGRDRIQTYMYASLDTEVYELLFQPVLWMYEDCMKDVSLSQEDILALPNLNEEEALAHLYLTGVFTCDRGVTHELVRHRPASFAQESTRYCLYVKEKFGSELVFIRPSHLTVMQEVIWTQAMEQAEQMYFALVNAGCTAQEARGVLPHDIKAEIVITANLAEWQHIFDLRYHGTTGAPHPHCKEVMAIWFNYVMHKEGYNDWIH